MPNAASRHACAMGALLLVAGGVLPYTAPLSAQTRVQSQTPAPRYKGIWEPVNYDKDVEFTDVFFVTADVGWAVGLARSEAGEGGFILHTKDAGETWELQFGDPQSATRGFWQVKFIDERHGWATWFGGTLLRTTDGENWEPMGAFVPGNPFAFVSPNVGFYVSGTQIHGTTDGGRTWTARFDCKTKVEVDGLARDVTCPLEAIHFATPQVGYAASRELENGASVVVKTEDAGQTWRIVSSLGDGSRNRAIQFLDADHGFIRGTYKLHTTADGGTTWRELAATIPVAYGRIQFADPEVGWSIYATTVSFTTDGGRRWTARETAFPTRVVAASAPRRDRAYVVGTHGMVYRLRAIPIADPMPPRSLTAPLIPGFASPLDEQVAALDSLVEAIEADVEKMPDQPVDSGAGGVDSTGADSALADPAVEGGVLPPASAFTKACCAKRLNKLYLIISSVAQSLPQFLGKHKNNNLLLAGLRMIIDLPEQFGAIKGGLRAFRQASDKESATQALAQVSAAAETLRQSTEVAFQKELPPASDSVPNEPAAASPPAVSVTPDSAAVAKQTSGAHAAAAQKKVDDVAKKRVEDAAKNLLKKKIRIP